MTKSDDMTNKDGNLKPERLTPNSLPVITGTVCPFCGTRLQVGEYMVECPSCRTRHHVDCWISNGNTCTNVTCQSKFSIQPDNVVIDVWGTNAKEVEAVSRTLLNQAQTNKKKTILKEKKSKSPVEVLVARYGLFSTIVAATLGVLGTCITAYFGYMGIRAQIEAPILATQTAESKMSTPNPTVGFSINATPTSNIWFTPYQNSFIEIISVTPDPAQTLNAAEDIPYSYKIRYFVPEFDWQGSSIEPHIQLERVVNNNAGLETAVLNDIVAKIGAATTIDIKGRFIVPSDRDVWNLRIKIVFLTNDGGGSSGGNLVLPIQYSITRKAP